MIVFNVRHTALELYHIKKPFSSDLCDFSLGVVDM